MEEITAGKYRIPVLRARVTVVGSGAAGYSTADALYEMGVRDILVVTEGRRMEPRAIRAPTSKRIIS